MAILISLQTVWNSGRSSAKNGDRPAEPESTPGRVRALRLASLGVWAAFGGLFYLVFRPGIFITDTYGQFQEALMFGFSSWHPPVMAFWWHILLPVAGAGAMLLFHGLLYWGDSRCSRTGRSG